MVGVSSVPWRQTLVLTDVREQEPYGSSPVRQRGSGPDMARGRLGKERRECRFLLLHHLLMVGSPPTRSWPSRLMQDLGGAEETVAHGSLRAWPPCRGLPAPDFPCAKGPALSSWAMDKYVDLL